MSFTEIELERLPLPELIESLNFEVIFKEMWEDLVKRAPTYDALIETDPAIILLQDAAYREVLQRQRINDVAKGLLLAYAKGLALDHLAGNFGVERLLIEDGDSTTYPPILPEWESDENLRKRTQLSLEGHTTAGSEGSYVFWGLSTKSTENGGVKDIDVSIRMQLIDPFGNEFRALKAKIEQAHKEEKKLELDETELFLILESWHGQGHVYITVLGRENNGEPNEALLNAVFEKIDADEIRPLTDFVHVQAPEQIFEYRIDAALYFYKGPDSDVVLKFARTQIEQYVSDHHKFGHNIELSGVHAALQQPGVQRVELLQITENSFVKSIKVSRVEVAYCTKINIIKKGIDE